MTRRIALAIGLFSAVLVLLIGVPATLLYRDAETSRLRLGLQRDALVLAGDLAALPAESGAQRLTDYADRTGARVVVVDPRSDLIFDTEVDPPTQPASETGLFSRPELDAALMGSIDSGVRESNTLDQPLTYASVPIRQDSDVVGALRLTMPENTVDARVAPLQWALFWLLLLVGAGALVVSWLIAKALGRPLEQLANGAREMGDDANYRIGHVTGPPEVQAVAEALDETAAKLAAAMGRSRAVAEEASHHLRTPLGALRLRVEALSDLSEGEAHTEAESALVEIDRLNRRIEQILTMSRGPSSEAWEAIDVASALHAREPVYAENAVTAGLSLSVTTANCGLILAMPGTVERAVDELTSNAFTYAEKSVRIDVGCDDASVWVEVFDDGPGIPVAEREAVFDRFVRGSGAAAGGTGLGLAMLRESARSYGGDARVMPSVRGTVVRVEWPRHAVGPPPSVD